MFNMNSAMLNSLIKSQLKKLKKVKVEFSCEKTNSKKQYRIKDQNLQDQEALLVLEDQETGDISHLKFSF